MSQHRQLPWSREANALRYCSQMCVSRRYTAVSNKESKLPLQPPPWRHRRYLWLRQLIIDGAEFSTLSTYVDNSNAYDFHNAVAFFTLIFQVFPDKSERNCCNFQHPSTANKLFAHKE